MALCAAAPAAGAPRMRVPVGAAAADRGGRGRRSGVCTRQSGVCLGRRRHRRAPVRGGVAGASGRFEGGVEANIMTANRKDSGIGKRIRVEAETLEALEDRHGIRFDTLILDIEGGEFDLFTENAARLAEMKLVILELHRGILSAHQVEMCTSILERAGLKRVDVRDETEVWARPDQSR